MGLQDPPLQTPCSPPASPHPSPDLEDQGQVQKETLLALQETYPSLQVEALQKTLRAPHPPLPKDARSLPHQTLQASLCPQGAQVQETHPPLQAQNCAPRAPLEEGSGPLQVPPLQTCVRQKGVQVQDQG